MNADELKSAAERVNDSLRMAEEGVVEKEALDITYDGDMDGFKRDMKTLSDETLARLAADEQREFERTRLLSLLREVLACGASYKGTGYAELQVPHWLIAKIRASVQDAEKGETQ